MNEFDLEKSSKVSMRWLAVLLLLVVGGIYAGASYAQGLYSEGLADARKARIQTEAQDKKIAQENTQALAKEEAEIALLKKQADARYDKLPLEFPNSFQPKGKPTPASISRMRAGVIVDLKSGKVLWARQATKPWPVASLSKIYTLLYSFSLIEANENITFKTPVSITKEAERTASSSLLEKYPLKQITVENLLLSALVKSANDSCVLLAQFFGQGVQAKFVGGMNAFVRMKKWESCHFSNPHGLPSPNGIKSDNHSSLADLCRAAVALRRYDEVRQWAKIRSIKLPLGNSRAVQVNTTNRLLANKGYTGLKTGFTNNAGRCLMITYERHGRRLLVIVAGCRTSEWRDRCAKELINWALKYAK